MSITFINYTNTYSSNASFTTDKPTNTADGDYIFTLVTSNGSYPNSVPVGWTKIAEKNDGGDHYWQLYYKVASSEGANYTWEFSGTKTRMITLATFRLTEIITSNLIDIYSNTIYQTNNNILRGASMNTTRNTALFFFGSTYYGGSAITFTKPSVPTSDWVENVDVHDTSVSHTIDSMLWNTYGTTGDIDVTMNLSHNDKHAFVIALSSTNTNISYSQTDTISLSENNTNPRGVLVTNTDTISLSEDEENLKGRYWKKTSKPSTTWTKINK